jgi:hypothetical protein
VGYFFIGKQKVVLFHKYRENGWEFAASALKCPTLVSLHSPGLFISHGVPSSLKTSFESEIGPWTLTERSSKRIRI